jgi:hypothetical protein
MIARSLTLDEARAILVADRALGCALAQEALRLIKAGRSPADRFPPDFDATAMEAWCQLAQAAHDLIEACK